MKKRILSMLMAVLMLASLLPTAAMADGEPAAEENKAELIEKSEEPKEEKLGEPAPTTEGTPITGTTTLANGNYYLSADVTGNITVPEGVTATLDLNGHVLRADGEDVGNNSVINNLGTLTINDSDNTTTHYFVVDSDGVWTLDTEKTSGTAFEGLTGRPKTGDVIAIKGGVITGGTGSTDNLYGGGIFNSGDITVNGVAICGNKTVKNGGGVYTAGIAALNSSIICGNWNPADEGNGGGIFATGESLKCEDCTISYNSSGWGGGISHNCGCVLSNTKVCCNDAHNSGGGGGGIKLDDQGAVLTVNGGEISDNKAVGEFECYGGGIYGFIGTVNLNGCAITNNYAGEKAGGIYLQSIIESYTAKLNLSGEVLVSGNTSGTETKIADNVYLDNGSYRPEVTISTEAPLASGSCIGITIYKSYYDDALGEDVTVNYGQFTENGATTDTQYFFSDNPAYSVKYVEATTGETPVAAHLELAEKTVCKNTRTAKEYKTIAAALSDITAGDTVQLIDNVTENVSIASGMTVTLDLNGKVLKGDGTDSVITNNGTLTVTDNAATKTERYFTDSNGDGCFEKLEASYDPTDKTEGTDYIKVKGGVITGGIGTELTSAVSGITYPGTYGGGILNYSTLTVTGGSFIGNSCLSGGGIANVGSTATANVSGCGFFGNAVSTSGGGVYNTVGELTADKVVFSFNKANLGGGVYNDAKGTFTASNTAISGNTAAMYGGGVYNNNGCTFTAVNTTVSGNKSTSPGGGVFNKGTVTVGGTTKIIGNIRTTGNIADNLRMSPDSPLTIVDVEGTDRNMEIGVYLSGRVGVYITGSFTTNGTADDAKYFTSDSLAYKVKYEKATTGETAVPAHLELVNFDLSAVAGNTACVTLENDSMTEAQAKAIAKAQKPNNNLTKATVIAYAKDENFATNNKYLTIKATKTSDWDTGIAMTLTELKALENTEVFVIGTVSSHAHAWTYANGGTGKENTITATCSGEGTHSGTNPETLTISAPTLKTYGQTGEGISANATLSETSIGEFTTLTVKYQKQNGAAWSDLTEAPTAAGTYKASVTVTKDSTSYTAYVVYTIAKADTSVTAAPTADAITYGQKLSDSTLTGGTGSVDGSFTWKVGTTAPAVSDSDTTEYVVVFTPTDTANYNNAECNVKLTVNKATPTYTAPTGLTATEGQTLADVTLPAGFEWVDDETTSVGEIGKNPFKVNYNPDPNNYYTVEDIAVTVTVKAAGPVCVGDKVVKFNELMPGHYTMFINDVNTGVYDFDMVVGGYTIQRVSDGMYVCFDNGKIVYRADNPTAWAKDDAAFHYTVLEVTRYWLFGWRTKTNVTEYYLNADASGNITTSKLPGITHFAFHIELDHHCYAYTFNGDGKHTGVCTVCGNVCVEACDYSEHEHCPKCGSFDINKAGVKNVEVSVDKTEVGGGLKFVGWKLTYVKPYTTYTAHIYAYAEGTTVSKVEVSPDGTNYYAGEVYTSTSPIKVLLIRVTDANGKVTDWKYENGKVSSLS